MGHLIFLGVGGPLGSETDLRSINSLTGEDCSVGNNQSCFTNGNGTDGSQDYPADSIDYIRARNPDAVVGYAHQYWNDSINPGIGHLPDQGSVDYNTIPAEYRRTQFNCLTDEILGIPDIKPLDFIGRPPTGMIDVLFGRVDFLESSRLTHTFGGALYTWYGAYYKLLNIGQRPSISGGTDVRCHGTNADGTPREPRTYVRLPDPGANLTYHGWLNGLKTGQVSIANGSGHYLNMRLGDLAEFEIGDEVRLNSGAGGTATVRVQIDLHLGPGVNVSQFDPCTRAGESPPCIQNDRIQLIQNSGVVWQSDEISPSIIGPTTITFVIPSLEIDRSSWLTARQRSIQTHTAATFVILDDAPIMECDDAEYWSAYLDYLEFRMETLGGPFASLAFECCDTLDKISDDSGEAFAAIQSMRDYAFQNVLPGTSRMGVSTDAERGPIPIGIAKKTSLKRTLFCFNGPRNSCGELRLGSSFLSTPMMMNGAAVYVEDDWPTLSVATDSAGHVRVVSNTPSGSFGQDLYYQFIWYGDCSGSTTNWTASDVLKINGGLGGF